MAESDATPLNGATRPHDPAERLQRELTEWRARIDELIVQLDLASMDVRDELSRQLGSAANAGLAALSGLGQLRDDLAANLPSPRETVGGVLRDLQRTYAQARAAIERG
jgi:HPt (histidine-containing phosphotransfer) domain-containing protein